MEGTLHNQESLQTIPLLDHSVQQNNCWAWKLTYKPRRIKNKRAILALVWNYLIMSEFYLLMCYNEIKYSKVWQLVGGFTLPVAGWLADIYLGRYKLLNCGMWIMWLSTVAAVITHTMAQFFEAYSRINAKVFLVILVIMAVGLGGFQANIIQFDLDQVYTMLLRSK